MKCRVCEGETDPFLRISTADLNEPFLDATLRRQLPELELCRCSHCGCLWANDARQDDGVLTEAYERVVDSYFDSQENDPRYLRFYKWLEQLMTRHVSGRTILDVGCGDGVFLQLILDELSAVLGIVAKDSHFSGGAGEDCSQEVGEAERGNDAF